MRPSASWSTTTARSPALDIGDLLLDRHATDRDALARLDAAYDAGTIGSRELIALGHGCAAGPPDGLIAEAAAVDQDPGFVDLVRVVRAVGGTVEIVSDGLGFYIEANLRRMGLDDMPIATNAQRAPGRWRGRRLPLWPPGLPRVRHLQA